MEIIGDTGLAQRFQQIIRNLEIDWEEHLSHWFGDMTAHKLVRILTQTSELLKETHRTISMDISEYLRYEKDMLPDREEVEEYIAAVDVLRNDAERLQLRIARLQKIITGKVQLHG
jgi:ubiquinone biosynthesis protein UbiJ